MKKIIFFLFSVVIIVTGALYSAVLYDRIQKKEQKLELGKKAKKLPQEVHPTIEYGKFFSEYESKFRSLDEHYKEFDNLLNDIWDQAKIPDSQKERLLSLRDRLQMVTVLLNYMWFDEYSLSQKEFYYQKSSLKIFIDSNYAHKLRILSDLVQHEIKNLETAFSRSEYRQVTAALNKMQKELNGIDDLLSRVKEEYKISQ